MPVTSSAYAPCHQQHSLEHSPEVRNLPPSLVSRQYLSKTIYLAPLPPTKDTCADTDLTPPPHKILKTMLSQHMQRSITCSPNTKFAPPRMYFFLPHLPTPSLAQCTPASPVHSLFDHSKVCNTFLLRMFMISMQSSFAPCPLAQMHPL